MCVCVRVREHRVCMQTLCACACTNAVHANIVCANTGCARKHFVHVCANVLCMCVRVRANVSCMRMQTSCVCLV